MVSVINTLFVFSLTRQPRRLRRQFAIELNGSPVLFPNSIQVGDTACHAADVHHRRRRVDPAIQFGLVCLLVFPPSPE